MASTPLPELNRSSEPEFSLAYVERLLSQVGLERRYEKQHLQALLQALLQRQKQLRIFFLTIDALQQHYRRLRHSQQQLMQRLEDDMDDHELRRRQFCKDQRETEKDLTELERQLQHVRAYCEQRRDKRAKRERQYHDLYRLPVINAQLKKKYLRARDKTSVAEQDLSDLHHAIEQVRADLKDQQQSWMGAQQTLARLDQQHKDASLALTQQRQLVQHLLQAQGFWCQFDTRHLQPCLIWLQQRLGRSPSFPTPGTPSLFSSSSPALDRLASASSPSLLQDDDQWTDLRLMAAHYEQAEQHGLATWPELIQGNDQVQYDCTHCLETFDGWPFLDKVYTSQLLCADCYRATRGSMVLEKKLRRWIPNNAQGQPVVNVRRLSSSFFNSTLLSPASKSTLMQECRPLLKKMKSALVLNPSRRSVVL